MPAGLLRKKRTLIIERRQPASDVFRASVVVFVHPAGQILFSMATSVISAQFEGFTHITDCPKTYSSIAGKTEMSCWFGISLKYDDITVH